MRIQPREQLLSIWRAVVETSMREGRWTWGSEIPRNSISDAEQLLAIMYPATDVPIFRVDQPDQTADDVLGSLKLLGDELEIPQALTDILIEYIEHYTEDGTPYFSGGSYFQSPDPKKPPTEAQAALDVVDSFSMSVSLMLNTIGFVQVFRGSVRNTDLLEKLAHLESIASVRLTAAMVGLLRSFVVNVFTPESDEGKALIRSVNQYGDSPRHVVEDLYRELQGVRASVRDFTIGSGQTSELDNRNRLFEIGWSWGVVKDAPEIEAVTGIGKQRDGYAQSAPFLYFTVNALDGIADLFSSRTVVLRLLNEEQLRLSAALRLRWELTQRYWAIIATFGNDRWPLEDIPWKTTDGRESDYYSLLVTSMVVQELENRRASDADLSRLLRILEELAQRGRITRRASDADWGVRFHQPGSAMRLVGSEDIEGDDGERLLWQVTDYSAVILKRALKLAGMARSTEMRDALIEFGDTIWSHLSLRRIDGGDGKGLWDDPSKIFPHLLKPTRIPSASWYYTERIVECLVFATKLVNDRPPQSSALVSHARDLLNEANNLFDFEVMNSTIAARGPLRNELDQAQTMLDRAREVLYQRPGTSESLTLEVLRLLDKLEVARRKAEEGSG
ncbi:SCO2524 family protein [Actinocorallia longicatena]|uniref:SCO2524 family protein n=1 Tax=Actinocorallia longicatena TaxID=111803 RepID=A0ABP6QBE8_9ACTN